MDGVECKSVWVLGPEFADGFVGCEAAEGLESPGEVVGCDEVRQVRFELFVGVVEEAFDGGLLDGSVHAFDLTIGPGMVRLSEAVFDSVDMAGPIEGMAAEAGGRTLAILRKVGELDSVVGEHGVDAVWNGFDECFKEGRGSSHICFFDQFDYGELRSSVDGHEEVELALSGPHLGQVDVEEADRIAVELLPPGLVTFHLGQTADAMAFETTVQRRSGQLRNRGLQGVETVVER